MIRIEAGDLYQSCDWLKDESFIGAILRANANGILSCNTNNDQNYHFDCVEKNQLVTATVTFVSPADINDSGNYRVQCLNHDLISSIIAQLNIRVKGNFIIKCILFFSFGLFWDTVLPTACHRCCISSKGAVLPERNGAGMGPANSLHVWRNTASIMKDLILI